MIGGQAVSSSQLGPLAAAGHGQQTPGLDALAPKPGAASGPARLGHGEKRVRHARGHRQAEVSPWERGWGGLDSHHRHPPGAA
eukprot:scaffold652397_cov66-Prasinocladus_malaysianus.AAC.1